MTQTAAVHRPPTIRLALAAAVVAALLGGCSGDGGSAEAANVFESERARPTERLEHDHSGEASALAPETVLPDAIAELGAGVAEGGSMDLWVGLNICGRFVELPVAAADDPTAAAGEAVDRPGPSAAPNLSIDATGLLTVAAGPDDPTGHDVTMDSVSELLDVELSTGTLDFGESWEGHSVGEGDGVVPLGGASFATGDECTLGPQTERAEVQLWYYTPTAVVSGEQVRVVVTDPEQTPLVEGGSALTIAFAPVSSLPTLPPAALVG